MGKNDIKELRMKKKKKKKATIKIDHHGQVGIQAGRCSGEAVQRLASVLTSCAACHYKDST